MPTIIVSGSTTTATVSSPVPSGTSYFVSAGGTLDVVAGGIVSGLATIGVSGTENVSSGGLALNTSIGVSGSFGRGFQFISSGGTASNTVVVEDGFGQTSFQIVSSGGLAVNTILSAGAELVFTGGTASRTSIAGTHSSQTLSGGTAISTSVLINGTQNVSSGGVAIATTLSGNSLAGFGKQEIFSGGMAISTTVSSGGEQFVDFGAVASSTVISKNNGVQIVQVGGSAIATTISSGGVQGLSGNASSTTVLSGGMQGVAGVASGTIDSGGTDAVSGTVVGTIVRSGGLETVAGHGIAFGTVISGGTQNLLGGYASGTTVRTGGTQLLGNTFLDVAGNASATTISSGGTQDIADGVAMGTIVGSGAVQLIEGTFAIPGGLTASAIATTVSSGGTQLLINGVANGVSIAAGGQTVLQGGTLDGTIVDNGTITYGGGTLEGSLTGSGSLFISQFFSLVLSGQTAFGGKIIDNDGTLVLSGTNNIGSVTVSGGALVLDGAESFANPLVIAGGATLEFGSSGNAGAVPIVFSGVGNMLQIDGATSAAMPTNTISGFVSGDTIDLTGVAFDPTGSAVLSAGNLLAITEGGSTYQVQFNPAQVFPGGQSFQLLPDGNSGTEIVLVPVTTISAGNSATTGVAAGSLNNVLSATRQIVESGGTAINTVLGPGDVLGGLFIDPSTQEVEGVAISTTVLSNSELELEDGTASNVVINSGGVLTHFGTLAGSIVDNGAITFGAEGNTSFTLSGSGTLELTDGSATVAGGGFTGSVTVDFGATLHLSSGALAGNKAVVLTEGAILELGSGGAGTRPISIVDSGATVIVDGTAMPTNTISGFADSDVVDLAGIAFVAGASATLSAGNNNLAIVVGGSTHHLQFNSSVSGGAFELLPDGKSGTGSGGLAIDDTHLNSSTFAGKVTGFGGGNHKNQKQFIDLVSVGFAPNTISFGYVSSSTHTSGTLFVSSGGAVVAAITMVGAYTSTNFSAKDDGQGHVEIVDPAVPNGGNVQTFPMRGIDLPDIAFGAQTTLAYAENAAGTGGTLTVSDGRHAAAIALLGNYVAGSFVTAADGHGGTLVTEASQASPQPLLTQPRHG